MRRALFVLLACLSFVTACADPGAAGVAPLGEPVVTLSFDADWTEHLDGELYAGRTIEIAYDASRLPCRQTQGGRPVWSLTMHSRIDGGPVSQQVIDGHEPFPGASSRLLDLTEPGELELWFEATNVSGCHAWDSDFGANYRFRVGEDPHAPGWMGNAASVISRATCDGGPCEADRRPLEDGFTYGTATRQRSLVRAAYVDVWKEGVTDFDNARLWEQLDARVYYRYAGQSEWQWAWVDFDRRVGNDARYAVPLADLDPLGGSTRTSREQCPDAALELDPSGAYVRTSVELYFSINGHPLRRADGAPFRGTYEDYRDLYVPCDLR